VPVAERGVRVPRQRRRPFVFLVTSYWYLDLRPDAAREPRPAQRGA